MRMDSILFGCAILLMSTGCHEELSKDKKESMVREVTKKLDQYPASLARHDTLWFKNLYSNEKDFLMAADGELSTDYNESVTNYYKHFLDNMKKLLFFQWNNGQGYVISKDLISYSTNFQWELLEKNGDTLRAKGSWLYLFKNINGEWKVLQSAGTNNYKESHP